MFMKRYSILATEYGSDHEILLCEVDNNPQRIVDGLKAKRLKMYHKPGESRLSNIKKYPSVRIVDNGPPAGPRGHRK
jgi:hypothetical protein